MKTIKLFSTLAIIAFTAFQMNAQVGFNGTNNSGTYATALGYQTTATGYASTALGYRSTASGSQSLASGHWSTASGSYSFALGARAVAQNSHTMAFGLDVRATGSRSMIIGTGVGNGSSNAMINAVPNSLMIGFNSTKPTLFVGASSGGTTTGKVGIGTQNTPNSVGGANTSAYSLYVKGGMLSEEVRVRTGWADYVFADDYNLKPLSEVEAFIKENKHLPNVPSAKTVESQGIELGNISKIQQEKIEELTLYIISQQKQIDELKSMMNTLLKSK